MATLWLFYTLALGRPMPSLWVFLLLPLYRGRTFLLKGGGGGGSLTLYAL